MKNHLSRYPFVLMFVLALLLSSQAKAADDDDDLLLTIVPMIIPLIAKPTVDLSSAVSYVPQTIELGWFNLTPCSTWGWVDGYPFGSYAVKFAPQEVHVYAKIKSPKFDNLANYVEETVRQAFQDALNNYISGTVSEFKNGIGQCALAAAGAAGLAGLASYGAGAVSTFTSVFTPCMEVQIKVLVASFTNITEIARRYLNLVYENLEGKLKQDISSSIEFSSETICKW